MVARQAPDERDSRGHFDQAVEAEPDEGDTAGDEASDHGTGGFEKVVGDGQILEEQATFDLKTAGVGREGHSVIVRAPVELRSTWQAETPAPQLHGYISRRPSMALEMVTSSANSRSLPTGMPMAMRVTFTPRGL